MSTNSDPTVWLAIGFGTGIFSFFRGFKVYREYHVIEDTPKIPIRSVAMGLVNVQGKATGEEQVTSPVARQPCYFYKVDIEKWKHDRNGSRWSHYRTHTDGVRFYLEDGSGKILLDANQAELDLAVTGEQEVSTDDSILGSNPASDELLCYISRVGGTDAPASGRFRVKEYCIVPGMEYDVTGTCVENPAAKDEHDRNLIVKGSNEPTYLISDKSRAKVENSLRNRAALMVLGGAALWVVCLGFLLARLGWW